MFGSMKLAEGENPGSNVLWREGGFPSLFTVYRNGRDAA
jgi:hypothetical protein